MADKNRDDEPRGSTQTTAQTQRAREDREQTADNLQAPGAIPMEPAVAARSDGWVTDTTPTAEPQRVIDRNAAESAAALQPGGPGVDVSGMPERPLAPGVLESSRAQTVERAEDQLERERSGAATTPTTPPRQP